MILEGILVGIFGNSIFAIIQGVVNTLLHDKDEDLNNRIYESLEFATKDFFKQYGHIYKTPYNSFLARESNLKLIVQSIYFGKDINLLQELDRKGFDNEPDVSEEHLHYFVSILEKNMNDDFLLSKLIEEKKHIQESREANKNIQKILERVTEKTADNVNVKNKHEWQLTDVSSGKEISYKEGEKYHQKYVNGVEQIFMFKDNVLSVDFKDENGRWSYYEIDLDNGEAKNNKFPYPVSEYKLKVNESDIIHKDILPLSNGFFQESLTLKWNRSSKVIYDKNHQIQKFEVSGGWYVNHDNKTISPK